MSFRKILLAMSFAAALTAAPNIAPAANLYTGPAGTGLMLGSTPRACSNTSAPLGCGYLAWFGYSASGQPVAYTSTGTDVDSTHYAGAIQQGAGTMRVDTPTALDATLSFNGGAGIAFQRTVIEPGRPGAAFNTIAPDFYATAGATSPAWVFDVQGSTLFGIRFVGGSWQYTTGPLVLDLNHATSTYSGRLTSCTVGPTCGDAGAVSIAFPRNNAAIVTLPSGVTEALSPLAF